MTEFRALLLTDVVDSTRIAEAIGDSAMTGHWIAHDRAARELLRTWRGREIEKTDGIVAVFDSAADAAAFAVDYHRALAALGMPFKARAGVHVGPMTLRENSPADVAVGAKRFEVDGLGVSIAARVMSAAAGGQTLLTAAARSALGESPLRVQSHGYWRLKGVHDPVELFEVGDAQAPFTPPPDEDKAYRVVRVDEMWQPVRQVRHNLAPERDAFIGRSAELQSLARRLESGCRLLTLLGPGGTGKTRIARRYAMAWLGDWPGGVTFCDLSGASTLDGIYFAVALALGVPLGKDDPAVQLGHAIAGRGRCLVILDNFEQVQQHATATLGRWLDRAAEATFVVTSRERLHLAGEEAFAIEPLALDSEAIELFVARAKAQRPQFELDDHSRAMVAKVVRLLDGLPLAIELAAARVRVLSPAQIVERLQNRFVLLAGAKGVASRQATLRAAIDWSWDLLTPWEQAALAQCSVFEGGFTLDAAEAVLDLGAWTDAPPAIDAVQALVDKSMLRAWLPRAQPRFDIDEPYFAMYLSIHEYASEKLEARGADAMMHAQRRHGRWCARFGTDAAIAALSAHGGARRRHALTLEVDNLTVACMRAVERSEADVAALSYRALWEVLSLKGPLGPGLALGPKVLALQGIEVPQFIDAALSLADAWRRSGRIDSARELLQQQLARACAIADRRREGLLMGQLANLDREQGHMDRAKATLEAALAIHREVGDLLGQGSALHTLGNVLDQQGSAASSRENHEAALAIYTRVGHRHGVGHVRAGLGILNRHQGRLDEAAEHYEAALAIHREVGDRRSEGIVLGNLANLLNDQGSLDQARAHHEAALAIHREVGSRMVEAFALANIGLIDNAQGRRDEARVHFERALTIDREVSNRVHEGVVLVGLGTLELEESRYDRAEVHLNEALRINRAAGNRPYQGVALAALGQLRRRQQRIAEALEILGEGEALLRDVDNPLDLARLLCVKGWTAFDAGDGALARTALREAEDIARRIAVTSGSELVREIDELREAVEG